MGRGLLLGACLSPLARSGTRGLCRVVYWAIQTPNKSHWNEIK